MMTLNRIAKFAEMTMAICGSSSSAHQFPQRSRGRTRSSISGSIFWLILFGTYFARGGFGANLTSTDLAAVKEVIQELQLEQQQQQGNLTATETSIQTKRQTNEIDGPEEDEETVLAEVAELVEPADGKGPSSLEITYRVTKPSKHASTDTVNKSLRKAFDKWEEVADVVFVAKDEKFGDENNIDNEQMQSDQADLEISFEEGAHGDREAFDGTGGIASHTFKAKNGNNNNKEELHFDDSDKWTEDSLFSVTKAQLGKIILQMRKKEYEEASTVQNVNNNGGGGAPASSSSVQGTPVSMAVGPSSIYNVQQQSYNPYQQQPYTPYQQQSYTPYQQQYPVSPATNLYPGNHPGYQNSYNGPGAFLPQNNVYDNGYYDPYQQTLGNYGGPTYDAADLLDAVNTFYWSDYDSSSGSGSDDLDAGDVERVQKKCGKPNRNWIRSKQYIRRRFGNGVSPRRFRNRYNRQRNNQQRGRPHHPSRTGGMKHHHPSRTGGMSHHHPSRTGGMSHHHPSRTGGMSHHNPSRTGGMSYHHQPTRIGGHHFQPTTNRNVFQHQHRPAIQNRINSNFHRNVGHNSGVSHVRRPPPTVTRNGFGHQPFQQQQHNRFGQSGHNTIHRNNHMNTGMFNRHRQTPHHHHNVMRGGHNHRQFGGHRFGGGHTRGRHFGGGGHRRRGGFRRRG